MSRTGQQARMLDAAMAEQMEREQARREAADKAMRRHGQMIDLVCGNLLSGRPGLSGLAQFMEGQDDG